MYCSVPQLCAEPGGWLSYTTPHGSITGPEILSHLGLQLKDPEQESVALIWVQQKRDLIINQMTDACLNQCLDGLISQAIILKEDYELIKSKSTRSGKVRKLIDTCDLKGESFARIIVQKLKENRQTDLRPFPEI